MKKMAVPVKTPRKNNFLDLEVSMIVDEISSNKKQFVGKFSPHVTTKSANMGTVSHQNKQCAILYRKIYIEKMVPTVDRCEGGCCIAQITAEN